jgi:hypothetical protein
MSQDLLARVQKRISDCETQISNMKNFATEQAAIMKEDIHTFSKFFYSSADLATQYLKDQLGQNSQELANRLASLTESFRKVQTSGDRNLLMEVDQHTATLLAEVIEKHRDKKHYRQSVRARELYDELLALFQKFTKDMFRKFKRFIQTTDELEAKDEGKVFTELAAQRERMNDFFGRTVPAAEIKITYRELPENLPKLPTFPKLNTEVYAEVLNRYGAFAMKELTHQDFQNLRSLPAVQLEDNSVYEGQWSGYLRVGKGKAVFRSGDSYEGYWVDDKPDLIGRMVSTDGDVYEVLFVDSGLFEQRQSERQRGVHQTERLPVCRRLVQGP